MPPSSILLASLALFVAWVLYARASDLARAKGHLALLRAQWGKPRAYARDLAPLERYHCAQRGCGRPGVDDGTWRDLDMDAVYARVDRAATFAGGARLYDRLRTPDASLASLRRFDEVVTVFERDVAAREAVQSAFVAMSEHWPSAILDVLLRKLPDPPALPYLYPVIAVLTLLALAASVASPVARVCFFALALASIVLRVANGRRGLGSIDGLRRTNDLLAAARRLSNVQCAALDVELGALRSGVTRLAGLERSTSWLLLDTPRTNEGVAVFIAYVNAFLLLDLTALAFSLRALRDRHADLRALFGQVGDLDAAVSVASFRAGVPSFTRPEIAPGAPFLELEAAVHPLVAGAVPNGIRVAERGVLVTGGNMSGKSTLVRTVAINALLAQTIYTTLTARYRAPPLRVRTLMSASDDVQRSKSYYYAELEGAKGLLDAGGLHAVRTLVVLDELFRGTNTSERIGAAKAVLDALVRAAHFVFASTHDRELVTLLDASFDPYHFGEDVEGGELVFPYDLRRGPATTRNAILLMRKAGFPARVVEDATAVVDRLLGA